MPATSGNDTLTGTANPDLIDGLQGDDNITGLGGNDTLIGGIGGDVLQGGDGNDSLIGGTFDTVTGLILSGDGDGNDTLVGGIGADQLNGGDGNDTLIGGTADLTNGIVTFSGDGDGNDTLNGGAGADDIYGGDGNDNLTGDGGIDLLDGGAGNDQLLISDTRLLYDQGFNYATGDTLNGGTGDDRFIIAADNRADNRFDGGANFDTIQVNLYQTLYLSGFSAASNIERIEGQPVTDPNDFYMGPRICGSQFGDMLDFSGTELVGITYILGDWASSTAYPLTAGGNDTIIGSSGADFIVGEAGADSLVGGAGDDTIAGDYNTATYDRPDTIDGGIGNDTAWYFLYRGEATNITQTADGITLISNGYQDTLRNIEFVRFFNKTYSIAELMTGIIYGSQFNDIEAGGNGNDTFEMGAGDDTIVGSLGIDTINGGDGFDVVSYGFRYSGNITFSSPVTASLITNSGSAGAGKNDTYISIEGLLGGAGNDSLTGNDQNNSLAGSEGLDTLIGGGGNDTLDGGNGNDSMTGGTGDDTYIVAQTGDIIVEFANEGTDTVKTALASFTLGATLENLTGIASSGQTLTGNGANNRIEGGISGDTLNGGAGTDTIVGGDGADFYTVDNTGDVITELSGASSGYDIVTASANYTLSANVEQLVLIGGATTGIGNSGANYLYGGNSGLSLNLSGAGGDDVIYSSLAGGNTLSGGDGVDTLLIYGGNNQANGGLGDDIYYTYTATDVLSEAGGGGIDTVYATYTITLAAGFEQLLLSGASTGATGNAENNTIYGNSTTGAVNLFGLDGADVLYGGAFNDTLSGGAGVDYLFGQGGANTLIGGDDTDIYYIESAGDIVAETATGGFDTMYSNVAGTTTLAANVEQLILYGAATGGTGTVGNDYLYANSATGSVTLDGGDGNDYLLGSAQADALIGGLGNDTFDLATGGNDFIRYNASGNMGADTVQGFDADATGGQDLIDLSGRGYLSTQIGTAITVAASGGNTLVSFATGALTGTTLTLQGVAAANVTAADFLF
jgi:Ca2+-binding RTX toxin-like protein